MFRFCSPTLILFRLLQSGEKGDPWSVLGYSQATSFTLQWKHIEFSARWMTDAAISNPYTDRTRCGGEDIPDKGSRSVRGRG